MSDMGCGQTLKAHEEIWAVSCGSYSDYGVLCICPTKEDAQVVAAKIRGLPDSWHSNVRVETLYYVTQDIEPVTILSIQETLWDDGTFSGYHENQRVEMPFDSLWDNGDVAMQWRWVRAPIHKDQGGRLEVSGTDHTLIRKVFSEKRAQIRAEDALRLKVEAKGRRK